MALSIFKNRYSADEAKIISDKAFYLVVALTLLFGFGVNALEVWLLADYFATWNPLAFYLAYFVLAVIGICLNVFSRNPVLSFIGYCLVVLPIGAVLSLALPYYSYGVIRSAFTVTALMSVIFALLALLYPDFFYSIWKILSVCLIVALIWSIVNMFTGLSGVASTWIDWVVVLIFSCYVGFDISFARNRPKTLDNAVDSACGLYLDLVNLFVRLLAILGRSNRG